MIETATAACSVALFDGGVLFAALHEEVGRGHAERLIPQIAELPGAGRADDILVDCGPGSFTGVRVGVAAARGLGLGWQVPVRGFSSLALIAASADWCGGATLAVAIIGGHGQLFVQRFAKDPMRPVSELASLTPDQAALATADHLIVGSGATALVAARGCGEAHGAGLDARAAFLISPALRMRAAAPIYGRAADAKPMA